MAFLDVLPGGTVCPKIEVMMDVGDPTAASRNWTVDLTPYLVAYSRPPERANEFDQPGPASGALTLRNDDARFIVDNAAGPLFGSLLPFRPVRVRAQWAGVTYARFQGYIVDWPQTWDKLGYDQSVQLILVDELAQFESYDMQGLSFASKTTGNSLADVLALPTWHPGTALDTGLSTVPAVGPLVSNSYALQRIRDLGATEGGVCFAGGDGIIHFHDRAHRVTSTNTRSVTSQATIGDAFGEVPYDAPVPRFGDVWPIVQVIPNGGSVQQVVGSTRFFPRTLNYPMGGSYLVADPTEALNAAQYLSQRYSNPKTRVDQCVLVPAGNPTLWATVLGLTVSDRVTFKRRFLKNGVPGGTMSVQQFVEGGGDSVQVGHDWRINLAMSPVDIQTYWALGVAGYGELGVSTRLFY